MEEDPKSKSLVRQNILSMLADDILSIVKLLFSSPDKLVTKEILPKGR